MSKEAELVRIWWGRRDVGRRILKSGRFSESELLRLIPNNWKRMHGLPVTRVLGKKKRDRKDKWKKPLFESEVYRIAAEIIAETLTKKAEDTYSRFADVRHIGLGEESDFEL